MDNEKKYNELVGKIKRAYLYAQTNSTKAVLEDILPELKESEDERIRKELIQFIKNWKDSNNIGRPHDFPMFTKNVEQCDKYIAWLEKQAEQKPIDNVETKDYSSIDPHFGKPIDKMSANKVEPKFKVGDKIRKKTPSSFDTDMEVARIDKDYYICNHIGKFSSEVVPFSKESCYELVEQKPTDKVETKFHKGQWIVWQDECYKVNYNGCGYELVDQNGLSILLDYGTIDENAHLWDITKDAKDGDVLVDKDDNIGIYKEIKGICWHSYIYLSFDNYLHGFSIGGSHVQNSTKPATKEQRDTLFAKMKEAGCMWDADKKELKKIEHKPAWSEEDETTRNALINLVEMYYGSYINKSEKNRLLSWLKSLRPQTTWKPSDEQLDALQYVYRNSNPLPSDKLGWNSLKTLELMCHDLKKLKEE